MIAERIEQDYTNTKYYQFTSILEQVIDCFNTIVNDESNPYTTLGWLTRKQIRPPDEELFSDLMDECSLKRKNHSSSGNNNGMNNNALQLGYSVKSRLERSSKELRKEIVSRLRDGCSPLFAACQNGLTRIVRYLIQVCEADLEQKGRYETLEDQHIHLVPPIWVAAVKGHYETVQLLIECGANVNSLSDTGSTPIRSVCFLCRDEDEPHLPMDDDADDDDTDTSKAQPFDDQLDIFSMDPTRDVDETKQKSTKPDDNDPYFKIVKLLIKNGADVSKANYNGGTCLINSLHNYCLTKYILTHGANINETDYNGRTALHYAIYCNRTNVIKLLLAHGASPWMKNSTCDDALQLAAIAGNEEIFEYLVTNYSYENSRLSDAYRILGSSILEQHFDNIGRVRSIWAKSIEFQRKAPNSSLDNQQQHYSQTNRDRSSTISHITSKRRLIAYGNVSEFSKEQDLENLTTDQFRIQSLLICERVLGVTHGETIQRILYRGTSYVHSMRPDRCIDLWIYALSLLLEKYTIFEFETLLSARAIKKLFLDLISQQPQLIRFNDVYDALSLLVAHARLENCYQLVKLRPRSNLHEDIFDILLWIIINLLLVAKSVAIHVNEKAKINLLLEEMVHVNPKGSDGSSLIHMCSTSSLSEGEAYRSIVQLSSACGQSKKDGPIYQLIESLLDLGLEVDQINDNKQSGLQVFCLGRSQEKLDIIRLLVERGAHVDRGTMTDDQAELIKLALREANVNQLSSIRLSCLAARQLARMRPKQRQLLIAKSGLPRVLTDCIEMH